ncbi:unnamed protein product [Candidula unifasciata]|uniref:Alpha-taxilin n=1 Tax=Candidula unifasciata TaxID=100452 RepID=A0A8S3ZFI5_9EUPU|nr:unnamed protein product [Candidula unifasciata]
MQHGISDTLDSITQHKQSKHTQLKQRGLTYCTGLEKQELRNPSGGIDIEGEDGDSISPCATVVPSNTPVTGDSGHVSPTMENSSDSLSDCTLQPQGPPDNQTADDVVESDDVIDYANDASACVPVANVQTDPVNVETSSVSKEDGPSSQNSVPVKVGRHEKREEKKKSKKKEDKSVEHILRALNSLQSPEEKLAALCKKFADLHEEHRVLQTSFKTQQRSLTAVAREKDQLQSEHTKAMMAKSKLESLCRELQKHNKVIESESIKRAKESDEKRKEISAHFSNTISEIQNQMSDNSEKNNLLRKENENLAEQLRVFMTQCQARDEHVKKLQEQHDLENKLAAAKLAQADAIIRDLEERGSKEKELMLLKLTEVTKKSQLTESQLELYKSKYDEFSSLHTRSSETFQRYKTDMDKMTKRIKRLEKEGLQWKSKWESTSKTLLEMYEAKTKSDQEAAVSLQKVKKLESLCRALQAELHKKKVDIDSQSNIHTAVASAAPPNSPEVPSPNEGATASIESPSDPCAVNTPAASPLSSTCTTPDPSLVPDVAAVTEAVVTNAAVTNAAIADTVVTNAVVTNTVVTDAVFTDAAITDKAATDPSSQNCLEADKHTIPGDTDLNGRTEDEAKEELTAPMFLPTASVPCCSEDGVEKQVPVVADS